jgi:hypothetical protein
MLYNIIVKLVNPSPIDYDGELTFPEGYLKYFDGLVTNPPQYSSIYRKADGSSLIRLSNGIGGAASVYHDDLEKVISKGITYKFKNNTTADLKEENLDKLTVNLKKCPCPQSNVQYEITFIKN